jgi:tetratricopeptide (TPR) repeat protein
MWLKLAAVYVAQGKYPDAEALIKRALAINEEKLAKNHPEVGMNVYNLGLVYEGQGKYPDAEALLKRALAIREEKLGKDHPEVADILDALGNVSRSQGKYADAEGIYKRALAIQEEKLGKNHPLVGITRCTPVQTDPSVNISVTIAGATLRIIGSATVWNT